MNHLPSRRQLGSLSAEQLLALAAEVHALLADRGERLLELGESDPMDEYRRLHAERQRLLVYYIDLWDTFELACVPAISAEVRASAG